MKLSEKAKETFLFAKDKARQFGSPELLPEHIILAFFKQEDTIPYRLFNYLYYYPEDFAQDKFISILSGFLGRNGDMPTLDDIPESERLLGIIAAAEKEAAKHGLEQITTGDLLIACLKEKNSLINDLFMFSQYKIPDLCGYIDRLIMMEARNETLSLFNEYKLADSILRKNMSSQFLGKEFLDRQKKNPENEAEKADEEETDNAPDIIQQDFDELINTLFGEKGIFNSNDEKKVSKEIGKDKNKDVTEASRNEDSKNEASDDNSSDKDNENNDNEGESETSFLKKYTRDLTKLALENKGDSVVGREKEIVRIIQILSRRTKNNPVLTGEPGVGKTAIVEGLAQRIAKGNVPSNLLKKRVLSLDLTALVAGTKYRGEFEERMKKMMNFLENDRDVILFIDEIHSLIGAGDKEGSMDASNILKPALSRGEIQIIGATTTKEYTKFIEQDMALERRFQVVKVEEPTDEETECILRGIISRYESYHNVKYDKNVISEVIKLSKRYLTEKVLPDKAIDVLDEAGAAKKIQEEEKPSQIVELEESISQLVSEKNELVKNQDYESAALVRDKVIDLKRKLNLYETGITEINSEKHVTVADIEHIISQMTDIPLEHLSSSESERIIHMEDELHKTVIGQEEAVHLISGAIRRSRAGISSPKHPVGSFIFLGPTGVGKSQLAKTLAKYLFGTEDSLIRIDMSDFMDKYTVSRLVGAPPGYIGYEEGGVLTERVRRHPYSVVLLDEIEKAHPDVFNLLLQILEEGELSDNLGHTVNFRNTIIIMTSNAGARQITNEGRVGFGNPDGVIPYEDIKAGAMNELKKLLNPELLNRIDDVIVFNALSKKEVCKILNIQLNELRERLKEKNLTLEISEAAINYLAENGYNPAMGARPMRRLIRTQLEDALSVAILQTMGQKVDCALVDCKDGKLVANVVNRKEQKTLLETVKSENK